MCETARKPAALNHGNRIRIHRTRHWNVNILPFARMSWPPSPCSNRLWEDGAKCSGIMLVLCDKTGGFYYKPTIVEPVFEKELRYKLCAFLLPHTENKWLLIQGTQTFSHTISLVLSFLFLSYRSPLPEQPWCVWKLEDWYAYLTSRFLKRRS